MYLHKTSGDEHGDEGEWEAHLKVEVRDSDGERVPFPSVTISWGGSTPGTQVFGANKDGKIDVRIGEFSDDFVTFSVVNLTGDGYYYDPGLNRASPSIGIEGPD